MTLFNTATRYAGHWRRDMTLAPRAVRPGFDTHRTLCGIGCIFFIATMFLFFALFLPQWLIFPLFFHIDIIIQTSSLNEANLCVVPKIVMHVIIGDIYLSCYVY